MGGRVLRALAAKVAGVRRVLLPILLGAGWLLCLFGDLLSPGRALANRDIAVFHLPLRASFQALAQHGWPVWNPWVHGGQPILSNPSYGAFYPPNWLALALPPHYALSLLAVLHAGLAFAGAWRLARHLGCAPGVAALASIGTVGCGAYLSLFSAYTLLGGIAWLPWMLVWADKALRQELWVRPALLAGAALGLQILNGEPSTVVMSGLALLALAASAAGRRPRAAARLLVPLVFAGGLAAVQLVPTLGRLADSPRQEIPARIATMWSMPPERLVEIVFPHFFGDPARDVEGLFFGWNLNDRDHPYIESFYPGLLLAVLGVAALLAGRIPRRAAWALAATAGVFLALGRHNPLYEGLRQAIPVLAILRYPEKFILLAVLALVFAGALGWQRLLAERDAGRPQAANLPLALASVTLATALAFAAVLVLIPNAAAGLILSHGAPGQSAESQGLALEYLRSESWASARTAAAVALFLGLCRWSRPRRRLLEALAVVLLAADLWHYGHALVRTLPAAAYRTPPPLAAGLRPARGRIFVEEAQSGAPQVFRRYGDSQTLLTRSYLLQLEPYSAALWHLEYAFDSDFELMLSGWGRQAAANLRREGLSSPRSYRYLGIWNVGTVFLRKTLPEQMAALRDPAATPLRKVANPLVFLRFRFVPRITFHRGYAAALAAARAGAWDAAAGEHWVRQGPPPEVASCRRPPRLVDVVDTGGRIQVGYQSAERAFFIAAMTYDRGWQAFVDGKPLRTYPSAACQLGVVVPAGQRRLVLRYREPWVGLGIAVSVLALGLGTGAFLGGRRRRMGVQSVADSEPFKCAV